MSPAPWLGGGGNGWRRKRLLAAALGVSGRHAGRWASVGVRVDAGGWLVLGVGAWRCALGALGAGRWGAGSWALGALGRWGRWELGARRALRRRFSCPGHAGGLAACLSPAARRLRQAGRNLAAPARYAARPRAVQRRLVQNLGGLAAAEVERCEARVSGFFAAAPRPHGQLGGGVRPRGLVAQVRIPRHCPWGRPVGPFPWPHDNRHP